MTHAPAVDLRSDPAPDDRIAGEWRPSFPSLEHWLTDGGDTRLDIDPLTGANKYGCRPNPTPTGRDFASSTASTISPRGWTAAQALANRLAETDSRVWRSVTYGREMDRVRAELLTLCDLTDMPGLDVIFAASGTDAHLIVADLVGDATRRPLVCLAIEPEETGSGVPAALNRRHLARSRPWVRRWFPARLSASAMAAMSRWRAVGTTDRYVPPPKSPPSLRRSSPRPTRRVAAWCCR
jgi:hypothetical protein